MSPAITAANVADFLGRGLLDVLIDLFREELAAADPAHRPLAATALAPLLGDADPVRRGDAAWLLGAVGGAPELAALDALAAGDPNADVREAAAEAAEQVRAKNPGHPDR